MKNITFCAEAHLIKAARVRARAEHTSLGAACRRWLAEYAHARDPMRRYDEVMAQVRGKAMAGRKYTRDAMNER